MSAATELPQLLEALAANAALPQEAARALPPQSYCSDAFHQLELERIFRREWHCVARVDDLRTPGDYITLTIAGEPLVVLCDPAGQVRAYSNLCRHRMTQLLAGRGNAGKRIVCPYHAWTYNLEGQLRAAPFMAEDFDPGAYCLPEFKLETWEGWLYVSLDPDAPSLGPRVADLGRRLANYRLADYRCLFRVEETWCTNWKCLVENFIDAYHLFQVHAKTVDPALPTRLTRHDEAGGEGFNVFYQYRKPGSSFEYAGDMAVANEALTELEQRQYPLACVYPAHLIAVSPERLFWVTLQPEGTDCIKVVWGLDAYPGSIPDGPAGEQRIADLRAAFDAINAEDKGIVESVRRNASSRYAESGPLSPKERSLWEFQKYLAARLL